MAPESPLFLRNRVSVTGKPDAEQTIIFVNGIGTVQGDWAQVANAFETTCRVVRFDHVGSVPASFEAFRSNQLRYLNAAGYARDFLDLCAALNLPDKPVVIGHSLGAMVAVLAAVQEPSLFSRLILIGASPRYLNDDAYHGGFSREQIESIYAAIGTDYLAWTQTFANAAMGPDGGDQVRRFAKSLARIPNDMMLTVLCSVLQADHRAVLSKLTVPTRIIQAENDFFVPRVVAEYMQAHIAGSELHVIKAEGHLLPLTAPDLLVESIQHYLL